MEYMMTYGWAILAIMVVGAAMWMLGIFNPGPIGWTSTGFPVLKPLLVTCEKTKEIWTGNFNGFTCQFLNNAGTMIRIRSLNASMNGKSCYGVSVDSNPRYDAATSKLYWRNYANENFQSTGEACWDRTIPTFNCMDSGTGTWIPVENGRQFTLNVYSSAGNQIGPCWGMMEGTAYDTWIDITYDINVNGIMTTKHESGTVRLGEGAR